jgi:hypothetical protein
VRPALVSEDKKQAYYGLTPDAIESATWQSLPRSLPQLSLWFGEDIEDIEEEWEKDWMEGERHKAQRITDLAIVYSLPNDALDV